MRDGFPDEWDGFLDFAITDTLERQAVLDGPPWRKPGGEWTVFRAVTQHQWPGVLFFAHRPMAKASRKAGDPVWPVRNDRGQTFPVGEGRIWAASLDDARAFFKSWRKVFVSTKRIPSGSGTRSLPFRVEYQYEARGPLVHGKGSWCFSKWEDCHLSRLKVQTGGNFKVGWSIPEQRLRILEKNEAWHDWMTEAIRCLVTS